MMPRLALVSTLLFVLTLGDGEVEGPPGHPWTAPSSSDRRSPCPGINTITNHGYIPHDGFNITSQQILDGFKAALNIQPESLAPIVAIGLRTSTTGNPNTLHLDDLAMPHVLEHDASLSRNDLYFGDNLHFDPAIWATTLAEFPDELISIQHAANARAHRFAVAEAVNPGFNLTDFGKAASLLETGLYMRMFRQDEDWNANRTFVKIFFEQERLPYPEGWRRSEVEVTRAGIDAIGAKVVAATPNVPKRAVVEHKDL